MLLPGKGAGSENRGVGGLKSGADYLDLSLPEGQDVLLEGFADGIHKQVAGLGQAAEDDDGFGSAEGDEVGETLAEDAAGVFEDADRQGIALDCGVEDILGGDVADAAEDALTGAVLKPFLGGAGDARRRGRRLPPSPTRTCPASPGPLPFTTAASRRGPCRRTASPSCARTATAAWRSSTSPGRKSTPIRRSACPAPTSSSSSCPRR